MHSIHQTAIVSKESILGEGVEIGPYCILNGAVTLGKGVRLLSHVCLEGPITIGDGTVLYPHACAGFAPQDFKFKQGDRTAGVVIGSDCIIREYATVHAATSAERPTRVGNRVMMMCSSHVGHDAALENRVILVNGAAVAGHSWVGEAATLSANAGLHQYGRVGRLAFVSASVPATMDVPPFCLVARRAFISGLNLVGMRRSGMTRAHITELRQVYRMVFRTFHTRDDMIRMLAERGKTCPPVLEWHQFLVDQKRPICPGYIRDGNEAPEEVQSNEVALS